MQSTVSENQENQEPFNTVIGEGTQFNGEFILDGALRIDGIFTGKILSHSKVLVGPTGHIKTNIQAKNVEVAGRVDGDIYSLGVVHLTKGAKVYGDIISANLIIDVGVIFEGRAKINQWQNEAENLIQ